MPVRSLRSTAGAARRRLVLARRGRHRVTVVIAVEPIDRPRLADALRSVGQQQHPAVEVLVCPVGSGAGDLAAQRTWQLAASAGAAAATGEFIVFLRGCDTLLPGGLGRAVDLAVRAGGEICSGRMEQAGQPEVWLRWAQQAAHRTTTPDVRRTATPTPVDLSLCGTLIRRDAWARVGAVDDGDDWLVSTTMARLMSGSAAAVSSLAEPVYRWFPDHGTRAFGATPSALPGLEARRDRLDAISDICRDPWLARAWRVTRTGFELPRLLHDTERADAEEWQQLRDLAAAAVADPDWRHGPPPAARALVWLAAAGRRTDVELIATEVDAVGTEVRTERVGSDVLAVWPVADLPDDVRTIGVSESPLVLRALDGDRHRRRRTVAAAIENLDADDTTRLVVTDPSRPAVPLRADQLDVADGAEATVWHHSRFHRAVAFSVEPRTSDPRTLGRRGLAVTMTVGDVRRQGTVRLPRRRPPLPRLPGANTVDDIELIGDQLILRTSAALTDLRLLHPDGRPVGAPAEHGAGHTTITLSAPAFGAVCPLPPGDYHLDLGGRGVSISDALRTRLPMTVLGTQRLRITPGGRGRLVLQTAPPLTDDELGPYAQQRLQERYAADARAVDPDTFYFESYAGRTATDSPLAIFHELRGRLPGKRFLWGIADRSQRTPDGAEAVVMRSAGWYDALATSRTIVTNTDVEAWFRRRPDQVLLQTFHGHPSKAMGRDQWEALEFSPSRVRVLRSRGVDTWSAIVTPSPAMTQHYREQYDYSGPAFEHGYPRNDVLVSPGAAAIRARTREMLGLRDDQTAVLYAPTWREHLAFRPRGAEMSDYLDLDEASRGLADDTVFLLRGHRFHVDAAGRGAHGRTIDVTDHPDINDLILASDVAVLDYSSLRFDYAITGKPMIFLTPDLEEYASGTRRFLFPFEDSAPGPVVRTTAEVVECLRDLSRLRDDYAPAVASFNATFNAWNDGRASIRVVDALLDLLD